MDVAAAEARLKAFFADDPRGALAVYLFGSVARGEAGPGSDVDVGRRRRWTHRSSPSSETWSAYSAVRLRSSR